MNPIERAVNKLKREGINLASGLGALPSLIKQKRGARILMYHGVMPKDAKRFNARHIDLKCFEQQIAFVKQHGNVLTLEDFFQKKFSKDRYNICITFDDGYSNNFKYAFPVLKKHNVPASFFITGLNETECDILWADFLNIASTLTRDDIIIDGKEFYKGPDGNYYLRENDDSLIAIIKNSGFDFKVRMIASFEEKIQFRSNPELFDYWKLMTNEQIREVADSGIVSIGSHGFYHNNLGKIPLTDAANELRESKKYLESLTQKTVDSVAYPDGSYSRRVLDEANGLGLKYQLAVDYLHKDDKEDLRLMDRHGIYPCDSCSNLIYQFFQ